MTSSRYNPVLHWLAIFTACATFPLIFMGGLVTSHQAGMSVPDWPNSYGYNMFLFPPRLWIGGILYEHTHRLMGTVVGFLSVMLAGYAWSSKNVSRRDRWLSLAVLGAVIFQGVLGGLRVVLVKLDLAILHACVAQAFFCLAAFTALATSRWWCEFETDAPGFEPGLRSREGQAPVTLVGLRRSLPLCGRPRASLVSIGIIAVALIYSQLIAGALMRHYQAGLAIPDLPLAYGKLLPPTQAQLPSINAMRATQLDLEPVTLTQIWLHFAHRIGAVLVTGAVLLLAFRVIRHYYSQPMLLRPALLLILLLIAQVTLGVLTVLLRKPADVASAHVAVGALVLVTSFVLTARAARLHWATASRGTGYPPVSFSEHHGLVAHAT